jgi:zinc transporter ZupT
MSERTKMWLKGLIAAVIGGAANAVSAVIAAPQTFNFSHEGLIAIAKLAAAGALIALIGYLKQSPVPNGAPNA